MYTSHQIADIIDAKIIGQPATNLQHLLIDSRQLTEPEHTIFIALVSQRNDGHHYILSLYQRGVKTFIVNHIPSNVNTIDDVCFILVGNTLQALQKLAAWHRKQYHIPVVGITGSNGKTMVKEWLYQLLKDDYTICRSPKSYNSQIGVPLSVWQLNQYHTLGIFEAGISEAGEMAALNAIILPTLGVLTSLGTAHDEGFSDRGQKFLEKLRLFQGCQQIIVNALSFKEEDVDALRNRPVFLISTQEGASLQVIQTTTQNHQTTVKAKYSQRIIAITIPFTDSASVENAVTCWAVLLQQSILQDEIEKRMLLLQPVAMRLELKLGNNNCVLINDFYNSDINALEIALHYQNQQNRGGKKIVILSDIEQSGQTTQRLYTDVAKLMRQFKIDVLIGIGHDISSQQKLFSASDYFFETTESFIAASKSNRYLQFRDALILLKGARHFEFENISKLFQQKSHDTVLEINLNRLIHNINFYRSQLDKKTKLMCMVKATGYGSGSSEIAFTLQHHHVDYLAVAYTDEGVDLRKAGIHLPIMVMSPEESSYDDMIDYRLEPEIFSFKIAQEFLQALQSKAVSGSYPVHIKLDTGMHRLGFEEDQLPELCALLKKETSFKVKSIFSHLVASDDKQFDEFTNQQMALFENMSSHIETAIGYHTIKHICNSGAITRFKWAHYNMVRLGIGMYGVSFNNIEKQHLQNINTLKTRISQLKPLEVGETVGYSRKGVAHKKMMIATIPIGYADGFSRKLGNGNFSVMVHGTPCKTVGNICMDMCMIDVTEIACKEGDEVIVFETSEQLLQLSLAMQTIPYEVLTGISARVKRVYVHE